MHEGVPWRFLDDLRRETGGFIVEIAVVDPEQKIYLLINGRDDPERREGAGGIGGTTGNVSYEQTIIIVRGLRARVRNNTIYARGGRYVFPHV